MDKSALQNYFKYVQDVLGIKQIFSKSSLTDTASAQNITVLITVKDLKTYSLEENNLLEKMMAALKLDAQQLKIIDRAESPPLARYRLNLSDQAEESLMPEPTTFNTWSPRHLLQNPGLKKEAWSVMQNLLHKINP